MTTTSHSPQEAESGRILDSAANSRGGVFCIRLRRTLLTNPQNQFEPPQSSAALDCPAKFPLAGVPIPYIAMRGGAP